MTKNTKLAIINAKLLVNMPTINQHELPHIIVIKPERDLFPNR